MLNLHVFLLVVAAVNGATSVDKWGKWEKFNNSEYLVVKDLMYFIEAEMNCSRMDAHLASIHSRQENEFVLNLTTSIRGSDDSIFAENVWIGLYEVGNSIWEWTDGTDVDYTQWDSGEPNNYGFNEYCAFMYRQGSARRGNWSDYNCHTPLFYHVCRRPENRSRISCT